MEELARPNDIESNDEGNVASKDSLLGSSHLQKSHSNDDQTSDKLIVNNDGDSDEEITDDSSSTDIDSADDSTDEEDEVDDLDLATSILREIKDETYICLICTCEIENDSKYWSCTDCYRVYHIPCITSWSTKGSSTDDTGSWKCPSCNSTHKKQKFQHKCWCKKVLHPSKNSLNPGSCGQSCGAKLEGCPHRCTLPCHPGPHATCNALGPIIKCHCGNHENQWPCVLTPYAEGWQCLDVCDEYLPCELHKCNKQCHDGLCGKCNEFVESKCYCGKSHDLIKCHLRKPLKSFGQTKGENWIGNYECTLFTDKSYDCGVHSESQPCQPQSRKLLHCPLSPDVIKTCHCGQTTVEELNFGSNRKTCLDPIPTCTKICGKSLKCGHKCKWTCHDGECSPCYEVIKTNCRCEFNTYTVSCKFLQSNSPQCSRKCSSLLSCRRHRCNKICCEDESIAIKRERMRKKAIRNNATVNDPERNDTFAIEASHICLQTCNKKLSCGNPDHLCQRTCHTGPCRPCLESSNDDLVCHCGQTVVMAPIRCGTTLPPCDSQCIREMSCGHQQMPHNCHTTDVDCPKCTKTVEKKCNCGKKIIKAMCYQDEVYCVENCKKLLPCQHHCSLTCHKGPCLCKSICGKKKKYCDHVDRSRCHFPSRCTDQKFCNEMVSLTCRCGRIKRQIPCGASLEKHSSENTFLDCEVSCVLQERDEKLREAFGIPMEKTVKVDDLPYSTETLKIMMAQPRWCSNIESTFKQFIASDDTKYDFKPMRSEQRRFIHLLAEDYQISSEAQDPEPYRSISIDKKSLSKTPNISLEQAARIYKQHLKYSNKQTSNDSIQPQTVTSNSTKAEFNSILIEDCIEGVFQSDLDEVIDVTLSSLYSKITFFPLKTLNNAQYLLIPNGFLRFVAEEEDELKLKVIPHLKAQLSVKMLAKTVKLVSIDNDFNILKEYEVMSETSKPLTQSSAFDDTNPVDISTITLNQDIETDQSLVQS